jgi:beta-xylosidase
MSAFLPGNRTWAVVSRILICGMVLGTGVGLSGQSFLPQPPPGSLFVSQDPGTYTNPILPGDYSDIDAIRVGKNYYAISSTFQFSPGMVVLHSRDLVNWQTIGHVVEDLTRITPELNWDRMNRPAAGIWAGSIRHHSGKFWVYFGTSDEGYFMSTATNPTGPWSPVVPVLKAKGWDDPAPFWDDDGQGYLVGTRFAPDPADGIPYKVHLFKLAKDGKSLQAGFDVVIHHSEGSEANKLYQWNGLYYHYYSEVKPEGRVAMMERAATITGPYEAHQLNHVDPDRDREPNQGGFVESTQGHWWFLTHQGTGGHWEGRTMSLLPVIWKDGWPILGAVGADGIGSMVRKARTPFPDTRRIRHAFVDHFDTKTLQAEWEWNYQPRPGKWSLIARPGWLRLGASRPLEEGNLLKASNTLTLRTLNTGRGTITAKFDISRMADGQSAGLCHFSGSYAWIGVTQTAGVRHLAFSANGRQILGASLTGSNLWLQSLVTASGSTNWTYSLDGQTFRPFGAPYAFAWADYRGDRVGIFTYNDQADSGSVDVDSFTYID